MFVVGHDDSICWLHQPGDFPSTSLIDSVVAGPPARRIYYMTDDTQKGDRWDTEITEQFEETHVWILRLAPYTRVPLNRPF